MVFVILKSFLFFMDNKITHWLVVSDFVFTYSFDYCQSGADYSVTRGNIQPIDSLPVELSGEEVDAFRGRYIRRLTAVLIHHIPAFWKVALSVFSGKFAKVF